MQNNYEHPLQGLVSTAKVRLKTIGVALCYSALIIFIHPVTAIRHLISELK